MPLRRTDPGPARLLRIFDVTRPKTGAHRVGPHGLWIAHPHDHARPKRPPGHHLRLVVPTGSSPTPAGAADFSGPRCTLPHARISIVEIPDKAPQTARVLKEQFLHAHTLPFLGSAGSGGTGDIGCHDITVYYEDQKESPTSSQASQVAQNPRRVAGAACLEEGQIWDVTGPENPTTLTAHTHIRNLFITSGVPGTFKGLFHTASFTWDGEVLLFTDGWAGSGGHDCDEPQDTRGNVWFYKNVPPGTANVPSMWYIIPRPQPQEACTMHNGNVISTNEGYFGVCSAYEVGTSVFDFSGVQNNPELFHGPPAFGTPGDLSPAPPLVGREIAFFDAEASTGGADTTSGRRTGTTIVVSPTADWAARTTPEAAVSTSTSCCPGKGSW